MSSTELGAQELPSATDFFLCIRLKGLTFTLFYIILSHSRDQQKINTHIKLVNKPGNWKNSMGCYPNGFLVSVPNAFRWELHKEHQNSGEFFTLNTISLKSWGKNAVWFHPLWDWGCSGRTNYYSLKPMGRTVITWAHGLASGVSTALDWLKQLLFTLSLSADHSCLPTASWVAPAQLFV